MVALDEDIMWKLYARALNIMERRANGHALPIIRKLAVRRFAPAMNVLSDYVTDVQAINLLRKGARFGDGACAYNVAITYRNMGDMLGYRRALAQAAKLDREAALELRQFLTRFPEQVMRQFGRLASSRR